LVQLKEMIWRKSNQKYVSSVGMQGKYCPFCVQIYREKDPDSFDGKEVHPKCWAVGV
jgi:hypothetical protein